MSGLLTMKPNKFPFLSAAEAASFIQNGDTIGASGFTTAGAVKAVPLALADRARTLHAQGAEFAVGLLTGASTGPALDGALAGADAVLFRTPYQSDPTLREKINSGRTRFFDLHLSMLPQAIRYGFFGDIDWAIIEACDITPSGEIVLTNSVGISPTIAQRAKRVIIELNRFHPQGLRGFHDIYEPNDPPHRREIPIYTPRDRIGSPTVSIDPNRIAGIVEVEIPDEPMHFKPSDALTQTIGNHLAEFLVREMKIGRLPAEFLPVQVGVGNVCNGVIASLASNPEIPSFEMYTEVVQDSAFDLLRSGRIPFASTCGLNLSNEAQRVFYDNMDSLRSRILIRPQEITNHPEVIRRLGLITINTALEVDLFGNVNSTHVMGRQLLNGIGGSGDFTRNGYLSIFVCPSAVKGASISAIVPLVSHTDHSEHSVQIVVTELGVADLRGKSPYERAETIIETCAHESYRDSLRSYLRKGRGAHIPQLLGSSFRMHEKLQETGSMQGVFW